MATSESIAPQEKLSSSRWQQIDALFAEALDLPPGERAVFLRQTCGEDEALLSNVEALLAREAEAASALGEAAAEYAEPLLATVEPEDIPGTRIGPYRLLEEIGRGGMGVVYRAERADGQFEKEVALKLVMPGMDTDEILRRFRYERRLLAELEHPHIARLYDGGRSDDGRPFLVMEYVEGLPIDRYCDQERLSVTERLRLFVKVCDAVQYAHRNLVVHRDLKPGNIMVKRSDGSAERQATPLLLDFGIAKLLPGRDDDLSAPLTRTHNRVMTLAYAAPEQIRGEQVTTATDIYALGVILYVLLTGRSPFNFAHKSTTEAEQMVLEQAPARLSTAVTRTADRRLPGGETKALTPVNISRVRGTSADRLRRRLKGDLDTIVLKALRKEPDRRYASAEALREDIERHLSDQPVKARADSPWYRTRKFVNRHRAGVAAAAFVFLSLIGGLSAALWQAERAARERDTAQAVTAFMENLFLASDPILSPSSNIDTLLVSDVLARGAERATQELAAQPDVQAHLLNLLGNIYRRLGRYEESVPLLEEALRVRRALHGAGHLEVGKSLHDLARLHFAAQHYAQATPLYRRALSIRMDRLGMDHLATAKAQANLAWALSETGGYEEAERLFRHAIAVQKQQYQRPHADLHDATYGLATTLVRAGSYREAEQYFREAVALARRLPDHSRALRMASMDDLASFLGHSRRYDEAEALYRELLALQRQLFGERHPAVAENLIEFAQLLYKRGDYSTALPYADRALEMTRELFGEKHLLTSHILFTMGRLRATEGRYGEGLALCRRSIEIRKEFLEAGHPQIAIAQTNLGGLLIDAGRHSRAEDLLRQAAENIGSRYDNPHPYEAIIVLHQARIRAARGDAADAEALYRRSVAMHRQSLRPGHPYIANVLIRLSRLLLVRNRAAEAEALLREALAIRRDTWGEAFWRTAVAESLLGAALVQRGRYEAAEPLLLNSYEALQQTSRHPPEPTHESMRRLAALYEAWRKPEEAARFRDFR